MSMNLIEELQIRVRELEKSLKELHETKIIRPRTLQFSGNLESLEILPNDRSGACEIVPDGRNDLASPKKKQNTKKTVLPRAKKNLPMEDVITPSRNKLPPQKWTFTDYLYSELFGNFVLVKQKSKSFFSFKQLNSQAIVRMMEPLCISLKYQARLKRLKILIRLSLRFSSFYSMGCWCL